MVNWGLIFRTRDPDRDRATDAARIAAVQAALAQAIESACRERDGLSRRLEDVRARAAFLYDDQDASHEGRLGALEEQMVVGARRLADLTYQIAAFEALHAEAGNVLAGAPSSSVMP
ncbi:hypothetical protein [Blastochloris viridis]|uniref:Outer membrane efflux protein n=1 Tax=Blastochloris viridis TaxID=1079 RepID=A0A0H5BAE3_BLAVI|nr:hypothetical protein [Blastochloris viridis]ALK08696.1 hypothetical protein BVIR_904 [Blastochloris viridis]BAR98009.1 hypothetical protein BV133_416 [Blastochloris viridis]CUU41359.1 hypothetical protein BVIRIDIS_03490 [Blastochloris viridis]